MSDEILKKLEQEIKNCRKCALWKTRNNPVVGEGSTNPRILFIGEAPGYWEDTKGRPFVGKAGNVLDDLLASISLRREDIYIANILKCRPLNNRNPLQSEIVACTPYLDKQIEVLNPKIIATLGNFALSYIFEKNKLKPERVGKIHGNVFQVSNLRGITKIIPLYHPAAATYNPEMKKIMMEDFKSIRNALHENNK
jgi:DNA polymerase